MTCPSCSFQNPPGFKFCGSCGAGLHTTPKPEAERRQISVMFCDLVGSTDLSSAIDAEDLRELVRAYQAICAEVFEKNRGHVAQYLGDGILAYFGYPVASEDSPAKAVESAFEIHERIAEWNKTVPQNIRIRTGIHTGTVVVGEMGAGAHREELAMGEAPNLAARLQGEAQPGEVVISHATYLLVAERVATRSLGYRSLKGLPEPVEVHLVTGVNDPKARRQLARAKRSRFPVLGYGQEKELLWQVWEGCRQGEGGGVSLNGDAGIGKSRLAQWLKDRVYAQLSYVVSLYPAPETSTTPLACVLEQLSYELPDEDSLLEKCPNVQQAQLLRELLGYAEASPALGRQRLRVRALLDFWKEMASQRPLLIVCDGAEYLDSASEELLSMVLGEARSHSIMLLTTWRKAPLREWGLSLVLGGLAAQDLATLVKLAASQTMGPKLRHEIAVRAEGNPFFAEELARNPGAESASRLNDLLMARLDGFAESKPVVQKLSIVGRRFARPVLQALSQSLSEPILEVAQKCLSERVLEQESSDLYFSQGLFHRICYDSLLRKSRQKFHSEVAQAILGHLPSWKTDAPEILAYHFLHSEEPQKAVPYLHQAGKRALRMSAEREAALHFEKALELLDEGMENVAQRITLLLSRGAALIATRGYAHPEVRDSFQKAREICASIGDPEPTFPALCGLWAFSFASGQLGQAKELANRLLELAEGGEQARLLVAHAAAGQTDFMRGEFGSAREHFVEVRDLHRPEFHESAAFSYFTTDPMVATCSYFAFLEHLEGHLEQRDHLAEEALETAHRLEMAHTLAHTLFFDAWLAYESRNLAHFAQQIQSLAHNAELYGFPLWTSLAAVLDALAQGDPFLYLERLGALEQTGTKLGETWFVGNVYRLLSAAGQTEPAKAALSQAQEIAETRGERFFISELLKA